jgi:GNAT superfamily N-acetyltransferase
MREVVEFVPEHASAGQWARHHAFRRIMQAEWRPEEPLPSDEVEEVRLKRANPQQIVHRYQVVEGDEMVAMLGVEGPRPGSPEYETNKHLLWAWGYVLRSHRRCGIATSWIPLVLDLMQEHGATVLSSHAEDDGSAAFLRRMGAEPKLVERGSRLDLREVDWDMVRRWVAEGEAQAAGARLTLYPGRVPDKLMEEYAPAVTELLNTMPFEGLDHGDIVMTAATMREWLERLAATGSETPTCLVREADGSIVGMTDVLMHPFEPGIVRQMFTGVHPRARGRGIGKWLKASMLLHVREAYPDTVWITTENAGSNGPMLAINHALGFRLHRTLTFYQVDLETLRRAR